MEHRSTPNVLGPSFLERARTRPVHFWLKEVLRTASIMVSLAIEWLAPFGVFPRTPGYRLYFCLAFGLLMASVELIAARVLSREGDHLQVGRSDAKE